MGSKERLSQKEIKDGGYTHLGYTYSDPNGNYYSLLGEIKDKSTDEGRLYELIDNAIICNYTKTEQDPFNAEPPYEIATNFGGIKKYQTNLFGSGNNLHKFPNSYAGTDMYFQANNTNMFGIFVPPGGSRFGSPNYMSGSPMLPTAFYGYIRQKNTSAGNIVYLPFVNRSAVSAFEAKINKLFQNR